MSKKKEEEDTADPITVNGIEIRCAYDTLVPIDEIVEHPDNPNEHPESQILLLMDIIKRTGFRQAAVRSTLSGFLVKGHGRLQAARALGMTTIPIDDQEYQSEAYELADLVADNEIASLSTRNRAKLEDIEKQLNDSTDADARLAGLNDLVAQSDINPDDAAAVKAQRDAQKISARANLAESFGVVPFSILRADDIRWRARKALYRQLGIASETGRKETLTYATSAAMPPNLIQAKNDWDEKQGKTSTIDEFMEAHGHDTLATTSIFDPVLCELMYRWFLPNAGQAEDGSNSPLRILDPFSGGSVRGIVAALQGHQYVGIDLREEQILANQANAKEIFDVIGQPDHAPIWIAGNSKDTAALLKKAKQTAPFDLVFTCPPYGDLEVYSDEPGDISNMNEADFTADYNAITSTAAGFLKPNRFAVFVVGDYRDKRSGRLIDLLGKTVSAMQAADLTYYNQFILQTPVASLIMRLRNQFNRTRKIGKRHQNVMVAHNGAKTDDLIVEHCCETITADAFNATKIASPSNTNILISINSDTDQGMRADFDDLDISTDHDTLEALVAEQKSGEKTDSE